MKKIIVGYLTNGTHNGIDKYLLTFLENVHNEEIQIDFLTTKIEETAKEKIEKYNSKLIEIPRLTHPIKQYKALKRIYKEGNYDIAYLNISEAFNCISSIAAKHANIKKVVIHSHSSGSSNANILKRKISETLNKLFREILHRYGDLYLACSKKAGLWLFPKKVVRSDKFKIIYNTIDFEKYKLNTDAREKIRNQMNWTDKIVIGHVGNFIYQKNHKFIIECFEKISKSDDRYQLALIGKGKMFEEIKNMAIELKLENKINFIGLVNNVNDWMQAMDIFILPSVFEGLPIVGIEAQASGLPSIFSDTISDEIIMSKNSAQISIKKHKLWEDKIRALSDDKRKSADLLERAQNYNSANMGKQFKIILD